MFSVSFLCPTLARDRSLLVGRVEPAEFLHPLPGVHLGRVDVALAVDGDVVDRGELPGMPPDAPEAPEHLGVCALDDAQLVVEPSTM